MKVETLKHSTITGKELAYVRITKGEKMVLIQVGEKTYNGVKELMGEENTHVREEKVLEQPELKLPENGKQKGGDKVAK